MSTPASPLTSDGSGSKLVLPPDLIVIDDSGTDTIHSYLIVAIEARLKAIANAVLDGSRELDKVKSTRRQIEHTYAHDIVGTVILCSSRQLAVCVAEEALALLHHDKDLQVQLLPASNRPLSVLTSRWRSFRKDIIIATPGRLRELIESRSEFAASFKTTQQVSSRPGTFF
jgi:ATP-dependent RNA helicase MSS116